jgi:hypothetical protein
MQRPERITRASTDCSYGGLRQNLSSIVSMGSPVAHAEMKIFLYFYRYQLKRCCEGCQEITQLWEELIVKVTKYSIALCVRILRYVAISKAYDPV